MEAMFFEHGCRDERQLVNGLAEFRGHASHSNGYEANSSDGVRNLQQAIEPTGFLSAGSVHLLRRPSDEHQALVLGGRSSTRAGPAFPRARIRNSAQIAETDGYGTGQRQCQPRKIIFAR
jgi:hypothetical protein